jgi:hypothetical protein
VTARAAKHPALAGYDLLATGIVLYLLKGQRHPGASQVSLLNSITLAASRRRPDPR